MHLRNSSIAGLLAASVCSAGTFAVIGPQPGAWPAILSSAGHIAVPAASADISITTASASAAADWQTKVKAGAALVVQGSSPLAASFGFKATADTVSVIHLVDVHNPALPVIWSKALEIPITDVPADAQVFAKDRWTGAPLVAGYRLGAGAVMWVALDPGAAGYERFPYLMQSLADLGYGPSVRNSQLWAFFDYSYRTRADPDYLAERWRKSGISALHVASWHFYDDDPARSEYLRNLIEACHRHAVLVYAWVELPHVSEKFWADHPEWREQTATLQDALLDWRKLMNLQNRDCVAAIKAGLGRMMSRFDWDGVNLAELYFESLEGAGNPARFTPMNANVRAEFRAASGWDPVELWKTRKDAASLRQFLDFRSGLARRMQGEWLEVAQKLKPGLDVVLTHVDDRFDTGMKDAIGADAAAVLPLLDRNAFSFLIEDPATVWNLGPQRYPEIAKRYHPLTAHAEKLAIDINIVDRYQDVYPTRQQTGTELSELVHVASTAFPRVALYFENSILKPDVPTLAASSAVVTTYRREGQKISIDSPGGVELMWKAPGATLDGKPWPFCANGILRIPAGVHTAEPMSHPAAMPVADLNAILKSGSADGKKVTFEYSSSSRAIARFERKPGRMEIDGQPIISACVEASNCSVMLPRGDHRLTAE